MLHLVEVVKERERPWTQPSDLALFDLAEPTSALRVRDEQIVAALLDGTATPIPASFSRNAWRSVIEYGDKKLLRDLRGIP
jgi:hypothetical protein